MGHDGHSEDHRQIASLRFDSGWNLHERTDRSADDMEVVIDSARASRYHGPKRDDGEPGNTAISSRRLSRVYSAAGHVDAASRYGQESLDVCTSSGLSPFRTGYALEALTSAAYVGGGSGTTRAMHTSATRYAMEVEGDEARAMPLKGIGGATTHEGAP